jgi:hypothetical protein
MNSAGKIPTFTLSGIGNRPRKAAAQQKTEAIFASKRKPSTQELLDDSNNNTKKYLPLLPSSLRSRSKIQKKSLAAHFDYRTQSIGLGRVEYIPAGTDGDRSEEERKGKTVDNEIMSGTLLRHHNLYGFFLEVFASS